MNSLEVVPSLLEERSQEVECHHDVGLEVVIGHVDVADGAGHAGDLLELELDGSLDVIELVLEGSVVVNDKRESLDLGEDWSDNSWHLLEDGVRGEKSLVLLGSFLDELLVLVELFEGVKIGELDALHVEESPNQSGLQLDEVDLLCRVNIDFELVHT